MIIIEFTSPLPNSRFFCELINLAGGSVQLPTHYDADVPPHLGETTCANVKTLDGMPIGEISLPLLLQTLLEGEKISTVLQPS